jgi:hypothetical protein
VAAPNGTAAVAQEESTRQTFETREMTGPETTTPENTTRTPTSEQSAENMQAGTECSGPVVVGTVGPTDEDLVIGPFTITGEKVRLTYETTDADESGLPFFDVTVLDEAGNEVGGRVIFEEGTQVEIVRAVPGEFTIEARAEDLKYNLTAEDCTGRNNPRPPNPPSGGSGGGDGQPVPTDPIAEDQYRSDVDPPRKTSSTTRYLTNPFPTRAVCCYSVSRPSGSSASSPRSRSSSGQRAGTPDPGILAGSRRDDVAATSSLR